MNKNEMIGIAGANLSILYKFFYKSVVKKHKDINNNKQYLFAFWHGQQYLPVTLLIKNHNTKMCAMVSPSKDGDILTAWLFRHGYQVIRGSSRDQNVRALVSMKKKLQEGVSVGFGVDGPIGPIYKVKPGIIFLSKKLGVDVIPIGCAYSKSYVFDKAWDKFEIPKPISNNAMYLGKPISFHHIDNGIDESCVILEESLNAAHEKAKELIY